MNSQYSSNQMDHPMGTMTQDFAEQNIRAENYNNSIRNDSEMMHTQVTQMK
jgi:hypothetical protein